MIDPGAPFLPPSFVLTFVLSTFHPKKTSEAKYTKVFGIEEVFKTDNTENFSDNTKSDDSGNSKKNLKIFQIQTKKLRNKC